LGQGARLKITRIVVETAIVPVDHRFVWRKWLPGSGTEMDSERIAVETEAGVAAVCGMLRRTRFLVGVHGASGQMVEQGFTDPASMVRMLVLV